MKKSIAMVTASFFVFACGTAPTLAPRPAGNPEQVDLSGQWMLRGDATRPGGNERMMRIPTGRRDAEKARRARSSSGTSLLVFLDNGRSLKVTQTVYGLFFSYDRAIVAEYNFGENRVVQVGPIEAQRVAGWDAAAFVIETMDERGNVLTETWRLDEDGAVLLREITIMEKDEQTLDTRQVFDRE
jgi:hypothetical protein